MALLHHRAGDLAAKDMFTFASVGFSLLAVSYAFAGFSFAPAFVLIAVAADFLDGKVARLTGRFNDFGVQLDSLADAIAFGAAPSLIGLLFSNTLADPVMLGAATFYSMCIVTRLAWFNLQDPKAEKGTYYGLPSPLAAVGALAAPWALGWTAFNVAASFAVFGFFAVSGFKTKKTTLKSVLGPLGFLFS